MFRGLRRTGAVFCLATTLLLSGCDSSGDVNVKKSSSSGSGGSTDSTAPAAVDGLAAVVDTGTVSLSWSNPADADLATVTVRRDSTAFPATATDGTAVYSGTGTSVTDSGLTAGTYYYAVFASDDSGNTSDAATLQVAALALGVLDADFDGDGIVVRNDAAGGAFDEEGFDVLVDASDRIVIAGYMDNAGSSSDMAVWRLLDDGSFDSAFNGGLPFLHAGSGGGTDIGQAVREDDDGTLLLAGYADNGAPMDDAATLRLNEDGTLEGTWGGGSPVYHDDIAGGGGFSDRATSAALDSAGRLLTCGESNDGADFEFYVQRQTATGTIDTAFNGSLPFVHSNPAGDDTCTVVTTDSSGRILAGGHLRESVNDEGVIFRLDSSGALDTTFDIDGRVSLESLNGGSGPIRVYSVLEDSSGRLLVVGTAHDGTRLDGFVIRLNDDGTPDTDFGGGDAQVYLGDIAGVGDVSIYSIVEDAADGLVFSGASNNGSNFDAFVGRLLSDGSVDTAFGDSGFVVVSDAAAAGTDAFYKLALDAQGRIVATGVTSGADFDLLVVRFE